jgi:hypothetical protein
MVTKRKNKCNGILPKRFLKINQNKMTAVEWLVEQLEGDDSKIARVIGLKKYNSIIKEAKEMERESR